MIKVDKGCSCNCRVHCDYFAIIRRHRCRNFCLLQQQQLLLQCNCCCCCLVTSSLGFYWPLLATSATTMRQPSALPVSWLIAYSIYPLSTVWAICTIYLCVLPDNLPLLCACCIALLLLLLQLLLLLLLACCCCCRICQRSSK